MKTKKQNSKSGNPGGWSEYYDRKGILCEISEEPVDISLSEALRDDIQGGKRKHRLQSVTLKLDPTHVRAIKKLATMKSIPYQTLIRHWLSQDL